MPLPARQDLRIALPAPHHAGDAEQKVQQLLDATRQARQEFDRQRSNRRTRVLAWCALVAVAILPPIGALAFPEQLVAAVPASIRVYDMVGHEVNIYGLEIRHVDVQHLLVDGRSVIAIKGQLANVSKTVRRIPWLHFGLRSAGGEEVYQWTLDTEVRPLRPDESTSFVTRLASPPEAARNLEIRFARADEIGSNAEP